MSAVWWWTVYGVQLSEHFVWKQLPAAAGNKAGESDKTKPDGKIVGRKTKTMSAKTLNNWEELQRCWLFSVGLSLWVIVNRKIWIGAALIWYLDLMDLHLYKMLRKNKVFWPCLTVVDLFLLARGLELLLVWVSRDLIYSTPSTYKVMKYLMKDLTGY